MRYCAILAFALTCTAAPDFGAAAEAHGWQHVRIASDSGCVKDVLFELEKNLRVFFNFNDDLLRGKCLKKRGELPGHVDDLNAYLRVLLSQFDLDFEKLDERTYVIKQKAGKSTSGAPPFLTEHTTLYAEGVIERMSLSNGYLDVHADRTVNGRVTDASGDPLPGVNIVVKGTLIGTSTDARGAYSISVPDTSDVLVFSFMGFVTREIEILGRSTIHVELEELTILGDEVVVVGYGTQRRRDLTGSIGSVSRDQITDVPYLSVDQALQGRLAGVQVVHSSGKPGDAISIRIRGTGTVNQSEPLFVIDGFPVSGGISAINVDDIESIDVLKDASAAAIYGARGANGVVIITTRRGHRGRMEADFNVYTGYQQLASPIQMLNASQYAALNNEARINGGESRLNPAFSDPDALEESTNWLDALFRVAPMQNYSASIRGGAENLRYNLSGGYLRHDGVIIGSAFERGSFRLNLDSDISPHVSVGNSLAYSLSAFQNQGGGGLVRAAMNSLPTQPVVRNGDFSGPEGIAEFDGDVTNPIGLATINDHADHKHRLLNNLFVSGRPLNGLTLRSEFGVDLAFEQTRNWSPRYQWGVKAQPNSHLFEGSFQRMDWLWDNTATYSAAYDEHNFAVMGGMSAQRSTNRFIGATGQQFVSDVANQLDNIQSNQNVFGSTAEFGLLSYMGRINYNYEGKYLMTATARYDGSSRFGANHRFGFFPSASAAWRLSQEPFMSGLRFVDDFKIRVSYGVTGNQEAIPAFGYVALLDPTFRYSFGNETVPAVVPQNYPNDDLRWEKVTQSNIGVDVILLEGRLDFTVEYYVRDTDDMLLISPIPITSGFFDFDRPILNVGAVRNQGFEVALNGVNSFGGVRWTSGLNVSFNRNELLRLSGPDGNDPIIGGEITFNKFAARLEVGRPIGAFYGYVTDGIFQNWDEVHAHATQTTGTNPSNMTSPGDIRFRDLNGDGVIDDADRTFLGDPNPDFYFGWTNNFYYTNFDLGIFLQGVYGNQIFNANKVFSEAMATAQNQTISTLGRWNGEGTSNTVPRATTTDPNDNSRVSDRYIEDGSYLRIKNVTVGYTLPASVLRSFRFRQLRIYTSVQNLHTFTRYTGFDPEVGISGIDNSVYPASRIVTAGVNVGF